MTATASLEHRNPADTPAAILAMLAAMGLFAGVDTLMKLTSAGLPIGELIVMRNGMASVAVLGLGAVLGGMTLPVRAPRTLLAWRMFGEVMSTLTFLSALVILPIGDLTGIMQFTPMALTAAAALFLKEPVGWRRWAAIFAGLGGVLLIVRPGSGAFNPAVLLAFAAIGCVVLRDVMTRRISAEIPTLTLTAMSAISTTAAGVVLAPFETWAMPSAAQIAAMAGAAALLLGAYAFIITALRTGDIAVVSPFRYSVILWALLSGYVFWGDVPDRQAILGVVIVVAAGLYTLWRERVRAARSGPPPDSPLTSPAPL